MTACKRSLMKASTERVSGSRFCATREFKFEPLKVFWASVQDILLDISDEELIGVGGILNK